MLPIQFKAAWPDSSGRPENADVTVQKLRSFGDAVAISAHAQSDGKHEN